MPDGGIDLNSLKEGFDALRSVIGFAKDAKSLLPEGEPKRIAFDASIEEAEKATKLAEAQIAKALGYRLCKCGFPPTVMTQVKVEGVTEWHCAKCDTTHDDGRRIKSHNEAIDARGPIIGR